MQMIRKDPSEAILVYFDFAPELASGETLSSVTSISQYDDGDATTDLTIGSGTITGLKVKALVSGGTAGTVYVVKCKCATSLSQSPVVAVGLVLHP